MFMGMEVVLDISKISPALSDGQVESSRIFPLFEEKQFQGECKGDNNQEWFDNDAAMA